MDATSFSEYAGNKELIEKILPGIFDPLESYLHRNCVDIAPSPREVTEVFWFVVGLLIENMKARRLTGPLGGQMAIRYMPYIQRFTKNYAMWRAENPENSILSTCEITQIRLQIFESKLLQK